MSLYEVFSTVRGDAYIKKESKKGILNLDAIVFDCDGVLIDVRESYNTCVVKTALFLLYQLTGIDLPESVVPKDALYTLKKSGGFNNDWDMTYAVLLSMLFELPLPIEALRIHLENENVKQFNLKKKIESIKSIIVPTLSKNNFHFNNNKFAANIQDYVIVADTMGIDSIKRIFSRINPSLLEVIDEFLMYPGEVGKSPLTTIFEELFCGSELFKEIYNKEVEFWNGEGLINREKKIITNKTLKELKLLIGKNSFGVASGRLESLARHTLGKMMENFKENALMFLEVIEVAEKIIERRLKKPHPYPLIMASIGLKPFKSIAYIGDSMEDLLMVEYARQFGYKFSFIGVYLCNDLSEETVSDFKKRGANVVIPTVNELPLLLNEIRRNNV